MLALPAVEALWKNMPALLVMVALPAVLEFVEFNRSRQALLVIVALPAVARPFSEINPDELMSAVPRVGAVDPPLAPRVSEEKPLRVTVELAKVPLSRVRLPPLALPLSTKVGWLAALLTTPAPVITAVASVRVKVKAEAPELKIRLETVASAKLRVVMVEVLKAPGVTDVGAPALQFVPWTKTPLSGVDRHTVCARTGSAPITGDRQVPASSAGMSHFDGNARRRLPLVDGPDLLPIIACSPRLPRYRFFRAIAQDARITRYSVHPSDMRGARAQAGHDRIDEAGSQAADTARDGTQHRASRADHAQSPSAPPQVHDAGTARIAQRLGVGHGSVATKSAKQAAFPASSVDPSQVSPLRRASARRRSGGSAGGIAGA